MKITAIIMLICGFIQGAVYSNAYKYEALEYRLEVLNELHAAGALSMDAYGDMSLYELTNIQIYDINVDETKELSDDI